MQPGQPTVFVVDDEADTRDVIELLVRSIGLRTRTYARGEEFLAEHDPDQAGCLVLDVRMPGIDGLELQERLKAVGSKIPIVFLTGYGDVPMVVQVMRAGAADFLEKPFREQELLTAIRRALARDEESRRRRAHHAELHDRLDTLTDRERQVLDLVVAGKHNKSIAAELGLSHKTVEFHRNKIMQKMQAENAVEVVRMVLEHDIHWGRPEPD